MYECVCMCECVLCTTKLLSKNEKKSAPYPVKYTFCNPQRRKTISLMLVFYMNNFSFWFFCSPPETFEWNHETFNDDEWLIINFVDVGVGVSIASYRIVSKLKLEHILQVIL